MNKLPRTESPRFSLKVYKKLQKTLPLYTTYPAEVCNHLSIHPRFEKTGFSASDYKDLRRKNHKSKILNLKSTPIQYQQGWVEFYKLKFRVTPDVLIPRPETELLVDEILNFIKSDSQGPTQKTSPLKSPTTPIFLTILDLGTSSGNIVISLAKNSSLHLEGVNLNLIATDISPKALKVAKQNAKFHGVEDKIIFIKSDLLSTWQQKMRSYKMLSPDVIVTNLPYIPSQRIPYLDSSVRNHEPLVALDGGKDGFELYRKLFAQISSFQPQGFKPKLLIGEIDYTHGELAVNEALKYFPNAQTEVKTDLAHKQRILRICFL